MQYSNSDSNIDIPKRDIDNKQYYYYCSLLFTDPEEYYRILHEELPELLMKGYEEASC